MQMTSNGKLTLQPKQKQAALFWLLITLGLSINGFSQSISLSLSNTPLENAFRELEKQTPHRFVYTREMMAVAKPVSIAAKNTTLQAVLVLMFKNQNLVYDVDEKFITVRFKPAETRPEKNTLTVKGKILDEQGNAVSGATITAVRKGISTAAAADGNFSLNEVEENEILRVSAIGYRHVEIPLNGRTSVQVHLETLVTGLDEQIIIAYGTTTKRLSTGTVAKVRGEDIAKQPVSNPLAALQGRVPGLLVTQSSGINGSSIRVQLRGQNSLLQGSEPLYIIDGVPFAPANDRINQLDNATGVAGMSPFNLLNPLDIESIEVLKDADATAIYGSRGANGVILITTKNGKSGKTKISFNMYSGWGRTTRTMDMLNTTQYLQMRREALKNDGLIPDAVNAPDVLLWDTTRYTDLRKLLTGGTAKTADVSASVSGGNAFTQFLLTAGYRRETTVFPTNLADQRATMHLKLSNHSLDNKFSIQLTIGYTYADNRLSRSDLSASISLPPHIRLFDSAGKLNWQEGGTSFRSMFGQNPLAQLKSNVVSNFRNLNSNLQLAYKLVHGFTLRSSFGYNAVHGNEIGATPTEAIDPSSGTMPSASFANRLQSSWIIEPQLGWNGKIKAAKLDVLVGSTWQQSGSDGTTISASNYTSDVFLGSVSGAGNVTTTNSYSRYRYSAIFGRINFNFYDRYIMNVSGRRDGSSRFGPQKRFNNFGAIGLAWLFKAGEGLKKSLPFLSFGKLKLSYGLTGNDQIGDYRYIASWTASSTTYQGTAVLNPSALYNPEYSWEENRKLEAGIELGFLHDKIFASFNYFRNRSGNQLVSYTLPTQTGFASIGKNLNALLENTGIELTLDAKIINTKDWQWSASGNLSLQRNKLLEFPGLESSSYANTYIIGKSVNVRKLYQFLGVDPQTGIYRFNDVDRSGTLNAADRILLGNTDPPLFGGLLNKCVWKNLALDVFFEYRNQTGRNYLATQSAFVPGIAYRNHPVSVLNRWQQPGDIVNIQRYAATGAALTASSSYLGVSNAAYTDASFLRCKTVSVSYTLPQNLTRKWKGEAARIFASAQNLFTITRYKGADPENQNMFVLPPLKTITIGLHFQF
jgi:TonB-linked SusC/RagA family outer membrane protein